jgi:hypothetical protein
LAFKLIALMLLGATISSVPLVQAKAEAKPPVEVLTGVRLVNVEKVDLASNTYRLDFYLWFSWTPGEINMT